MKFHQESAEIYIPDGLALPDALRRTTDLAIAAHQDDIEIMAAGPILQCFQRTDRWFSGVVVTDGRGSPRDGLYQKYSDEEMRLVRFARGEILFWQGDPSAGLHIIREGSVKLFKLSPQGRELIINTYEDGATFNEVSDQPSRCVPGSLWLCGFRRCAAGHQPYGA